MKRQIADQLKQWLIKKDRKLKNLFIATIKNFDPSLSINIGKGVFKIRIHGFNKGKSSGYRAYLFVIDIKKILIPLCIYPKNELENLTKKDLTTHLIQIKTEIKNLY